MSQAPFHCDHERRYRWQCYRAAPSELLHQLHTGLQCWRFSICPMIECMPYVKALRKGIARMASWGLLNVWDLYRKVHHVEAHKLRIIRFCHKFSYQWGHAPKCITCTSKKGPCRSCSTLSMTKLIMQSLWALHNTHKYNPCINSHSILWYVLCSMGSEYR